MADAQSDSVFRDGAGELRVRRESPQLLLSFARGPASETLVLTYIREIHSFIDKASH
jgi:hypothetical protein